MSSDEYSPLISRRALPRYSLYPLHQTTMTVQSTVKIGQESRSLWGCRRLCPCYFPSSKFFCVEPISIFMEFGFSSSF